MNTIKKGDNLMISTVYTYRNKQVVLFHKPKFYYIKNKKALSILIDELLEIDAVATPCDLNFPCVLELQTGFAPKLNLSSLKEYSKSMSKHFKNIKKEHKLIRSLNKKKI